ncbi:uncharacterized protein LOC127752260, partial [Frankliniella occidentalis]|uniref:Uncharacterized protein LOC127752260 n=1 Tax=Frankliniella occidentalis TaxID=133901 RepID=A0A9C6XVX8_FRAOC
MDETTRCGTQPEDAPSTTAGITRSTPALCSRPSLQRGEAVSADEPDGPAAGRERRRSTTSVHLDLQPSVVDILVAPQTSPPASPPAHLHSFVGPRDVNVTSRDEAVPEQCGPEEALDNMRRRNFPKVLPDFPGVSSGVPSGVPAQQLQMSAMQLAARRRSLPPGQLQMLRTYPGPYPTIDEADTGAYNRMRPAPPPRISSTLGRRPQQQ